MPYSCSTAPAGTPATSSRRQTTSRFSACRPTPPNSTQSRTSGSICARTTSPCASTTPMTLSSMPAAMPGPTSSRLPQDSPPSLAAHGQPCHELRRLVLVARFPLTRDRATLTWATPAVARARSIDLEGVVKDEPQVVDRGADVVLVRCRETVPRPQPEALQRFEVGPPFKIEVPFALV